MEKILFCICTFNRNRSLIKCLENINKIKLIKKFDIEILIIDNTINFTSKKVIEKYKKKSSFKIFIKNEKKRGIVFARNACLDFIKKKKMKYVSFIDDDCIFDINWIINSQFHMQLLLYRSRTDRKTSCQQACLQVVLIQIRSRNGT